MTKFMLTAFVLALGAFAIAADEKVKVEEKKPAVGALPPNPLDAAFEKATTPKALDEALLNDPVYKAAIQEALKAKRGQEEFYKKNPGAVGPSPAQAARQKFLEVLTAGKVEEEVKK